MKKHIYTLVLVLALTSTVVSAQTPSQEDIYKNAFKELNSMLTGEKPISFKRAVFVAENAYLDNQLSYDVYSERIAGLVRLTKAIAKSDGLLYDKKDRRQVLLSASIFRALKDTVVIRYSQSGKLIRKNPYSYDMEDFWGEVDWTKMFVTKLITTESGNCHSLPALYKILADELGVPAWLSVAPNHTYIKQWNDKDGWYNTELTTGRFPFDADIKWNSYISTDAIRAGVYMDTLSEKENIAYVLTDLVQGYIRNAGSNDLETAVSCLNIALHYYPDYLNALILKAELRKQLLLAKGSEFDITTVKEFRNGRLNGQFAELEKLYSEIHQLGYRRMPKEMYLNWLFRARKDSTRQPYKFSTPQPFKSYSYKVQMVTAGDGQNYEFYDQDPVVRIGTVQYDRTTNQIQGFVVEQSDEFPDDVVSRMYDPALGRWWQVDPLSELSRRMSPYSFCYNNPMIFVDVDGMFGDYYLADGTHLGSDGKNDDKAYVVSDYSKSQTTNADGKSTTVLAESQVSEVKDSNGNAVSNSSLQTMAAAAYGESSGDAKETYAISSAIVNNNHAREANGQDETFGATAQRIARALTDGNDRTSDYQSATPGERNANAGMKTAMAGAINAATGGTDYSNGATGWDGADLKLSSNDHRYGLNVANSGHDIYNVGDRPLTTPVRGASYKRQTTAAQGGSVFMRIHPDWVSKTGAPAY